MVPPSVLINCSGQKLGSLAEHSVHGLFVSLQEVADESWLQEDADGSCAFAYI